MQIRREAQRGKGALLSARIDPARRRPIGPLAELAAAASTRRRGFYPRAGFRDRADAAAAGRARTQILADDPAVLRELRHAFPAADIAHRADRAIGRSISMRCSTARWRRPLALAGRRRLHIEEARAAVLIDVDTGTPETGSAERARAWRSISRRRAAIARQLRLRQLGGGIVVDFAGARRAGARERVRQALAAALAGDPARPQLLGWTRLGHLEIVRPRRFRSLSRSNARTRRASVKARRRWPSRRCAGSRREARANPAANWRLAVVPAVEAALRGPAAAALRALEIRLGRRVAIAVERATATRIPLTSRPCETISAAWPIPATKIPSRRCPPAPPLSDLRQAGGRAHQPFCSGRCANIDLGRWLKGNYRVPTEDPPDDDPDHGEG